MAARRRAGSGQAYMYGSTAPAERTRRQRQVQTEDYTRYEQAAARQRQARAERLEREAVRYQQRQRAVRRNQEKALQMDLPYVVMLTIAAFCALYICVGYLHIQSSITGRIYNIEKLEQELEQLRSENDALQTRINTEIDLDHIYKVATEELGMVYANKDQVRLYDKTESEYVRQYEDIPTH